MHLKKNEIYNTDFGFWLLKQNGIKRQLKTYRKTSWDIFFHLNY